ncbi:MAG: hypothetical protein ABIR16_08670 [Dokdonella sp.]
MRVLPCWLLLLMLLFVAGTSHADGLADLRTTLTTLNGSAPITARLSVQKNSKNGDADEPKAMSAQSAVIANAGPNGMQISYDAATLDKVEAEANQRSTDTEATTPLADLLRDITPTQVNAMLSFAGPLLRRLEQASLKADAADTLEGKPARLLTFEVPLNVSKKDRDSMKEYTGILKVWLDGDGTPLAIDQQQVFSGRRMLISFKGSNSETATLSREGERLVMVRQKRGQSFSGFGQIGDSSTTTTLTIQ